MNGRKYFEISVMKKIIQLLPTFFSLTKSKEYVRSDANCTLKIKFVCCFLLRRRNYIDDFHYTFFLLFPFWAHRGCKFIFVINDGQLRPCFWLELKFWVTHRRAAGAESQEIQLSSVWRKTNGYITAPHSKLALTHILFQS